MRIYGRCNMIIGIGIDVVEIDRVKSAVERELFVQQVFTPNEAAYCRSRGVQQAASFAARFAAKEAVAKAFGCGLAIRNIKEIEIVIKDKGRPSIVLHGGFAKLAAERGVTNMHISLTHARAYAAAQAVLEGGGK